MDALAVTPRELDELGHGGHELGAIGEAALLVELTAILDAPVPVGVGDVVLIVVDIHEDARLGTQVPQESFEICFERLLGLSPMVSSFMSGASSAGPINPSGFSKPGASV